MGLVLLDVGGALSVVSLRLYGHTAMGLLLGRVLLANLTGTGESFGISHRVLTVAPAVAALYFVSSWLKRGETGGAIRTWERGLSRAYLYAGTLVAVLLVRFELGATAGIAGWGIITLGLAALGVRWNERDLRRQSYLVAILAFVRSVVTNFYVPDSLAGASGRFTIAGIVIGSFYIVHVLLPRVAGERESTSSRAGALLN